MKKIKKNSTHGQYFIFSQDGKQGVAKKRFLRSPEVIIPVKVDKVEPALEFGKAIFKITNGPRCGLYNVVNKCSLLPVLYRTIDFGWEGRAIISFSEKDYRVVSYKTEEIIKSSDFIFPISYKGKKCFGILRKGKYGIFDCNSKVVIPFSYDYLCVYMSRYLIYRLDGECSLCRLSDGEVLYKTTERIEFEDYYFCIGYKQIVYRDVDAEYNRIFADALVESIRDRVSF